MAITTPVRRAVAHPVVTLAGHVRTAVAAGVVTALVAVLALWAFDHVPGLRAESEPVLSPAVVDEIATIEASGLTCGTTPRLTDHVVVELVDGSVSTLPMTAALDLARDQGGIARAYCV